METKESIKSDRSIINKSSFRLSDNDILLLSRGLKFVPTPNWNKKISDKEWYNIGQHIRKIEWAEINEGETDKIEAYKKTNEQIRSKKLKTPKFSSPESAL